MILPPCGSNLAFRLRRRRFLPVERTKVRPEIDDAPSLHEASSRDNAANLLRMQRERVVRRSSTRGTSGLGIARTRFSTMRSAPPDTFSA